MADKVLDADYIARLLSGKRTLTDKPPKPDNTPAVFVSEIKPDPLKLQQAGEMQKGDKGDIWAQWLKQGRRGARALIERWG